MTTLSDSELHERSEEVKSVPKVPSKRSRVYKAPQKWTNEFGIPSIFLAGSIEMGAAVNWQQYIEQELADRDVIIVNPRRDDWDSSWVQSIDNPKFREQVEWELNSLHKANIIAVYFDPATKSPITLLELGLHAISTSRMVVCCPAGYWRKGNVDVVCSLYHIEQVATLAELAQKLAAWCPKTVEANTDTANPSSAPSKSRGGE